MAAGATVRGNLSRAGAYLFTLLLALGDRVTRKRSLVVFRTYPDFDAQGIEVLRAMSRSGAMEMAWLSDGDKPPRDWPEEVSVLPARSWRGVHALWRARVVVHTHGVYGGYRPSPSKTFVNVWHGMPIKRLVADGAVGRHQTTFTIATSALHAAHLAETWSLDMSQVWCTGLPRNDVMMRSAQQRGAVNDFTIWGDKPLVLWLPTYRRSSVGDIRSDGRDAGNVFQIPGASLAAVDEMARRLGVHVVVKLHPMAELQATAEYPNLSVWDERSLKVRFDSLYDLLGRAEILITDYSSVWIDFLLLQRPIVFCAGDLNEYAENRGFYVPLDSSSVPGPLVDSLNALEGAVRNALAGPDPEALMRLQKARGLHHAHVDASAGCRVADMVLGKVAE